MAELISDSLWKEIEPLIPKRRISPKGGRPAVGDREVLTGIVFVLKSGITWNMLPQEMGCGSGVTCWRRLKEWTQAKVWSSILHHLLAALSKASKLETSRAVADSASMRAVFGGPILDPIPPIVRKKAANAMC
jgi:transposase